MRRPSAGTETQVMQLACGGGGPNAEHWSRKRRRDETMDYQGQGESHTMLTRSQGIGVQVWVELRAILVVPETAMEMWGTGHLRVTDKETVMSTNRTEGLVDLTVFVILFDTQDQADTECSLSLAHTFGVH